MAAVAAATLAAVSACGGADASSSASSSASAGSTASKAPTHVKLLLAPVYFESAYVAQEKGYFEKHGLDVEMVEGSTADAQIPQLLNGQAEFGMSAGVAMVAAVSQGLPVTIILGDQNAAPTTPLTSGILVPPNSPIHSYADLAGKTVGLQSLKDTTQLATMLAVAKAGADPTTIKFVNVPLPTLNDAALKGSVDAIFNIGSFYPTGVQSGLRELGSPTTDALLGGPNVVFAASQAYTKQHPDQVKAFNAAMTEAMADVKADPQLVRDQDLKHTKQPPEYIKSAPVAPVTPNINKAGMKTTIDGMIKYKFIDKAVKFSDVVSSLCPTS